MASAPLAKRRKSSVEVLQRLLHTGGVSQLGLKSLLKEIRTLDNDDIASASRRALHDANLGAFKELASSKQMPLEAGGSWEWKFLDPNRLLADRAEGDHRLQALFVEALRRRPQSAAEPWHLIVGFDEFVPGRCDVNEMVLPFGGKASQPQPTTLSVGAEVGVLLLGARPFRLFRK